MEEVSAGLPVALTVSDYTGHTCALWEARFPELRQMALEQCRWFKEEEVGKGERHIFLFDRLPAAQRIVYIALSDTIAVLVGEEAKSLSMFFETNKRKVPDFT